MTIVFEPFPKIPRLEKFNQNWTFTEKIDGTNACVVISDDGTIAAQSRNRLITVHDDNFGFAGWVEKNKDDLRKLGTGHHFGEWWGLGIGRGYGLDHKRFSLFNVLRWNPDNPNKPDCCHVVPVLKHPAKTEDLAYWTVALKEQGSVASPGFMQPEGIMCFNHELRTYFKHPFEQEHKGKIKIGTEAAGGSA